MTTGNPFVLEFEDFNRQGDIEISKVLTTPKGERIRAIITATNGVILTSLDCSNGNTVIFNGEGQSVELWGEIWDGIKSFVGAVANKLTQGQNCTPVTTQTITTHANGTVTITSTTTLDCKPA